MAIATHGASRLLLLTSLLAARLVAAGVKDPCVKDGVVVASCYGWNATDSTASLQAALSSNASLVIVDKQPTAWLVRPLTVTSDNMVVHFSDDVLVLAQKGEFLGTGDGLLTLNRRRNVTLRGGRNATLQMRRSDYADPSKYKHSEFRMGLILVDSVDITISGLTISDTGGDGIFIGGGVPCRFPGDHRCAPGSPGCLRVHIADCVLRNAYRNAMSVISAVDLLVERTQFVGTNGTNPKAGLDLEPDYYQQNFQNVTFKDCISSNNAGAGYSVALNKLNSSSNPISILMQNFTVDGGTSEGAVIGGVRPGLRGSINVTDSLVRGTYGGSGIYDKASDGAPVRFTRCRFENVGTHPFATGMSHQPLIVYGSGNYHGNDRSYDVGGVVFTDVTVVDDHARAFLQGDTPKPRVVRGVHGSITVHNPFGCNMSWQPGTVQEDVVVTCVAASGGTSTGASSGQNSGETVADRLWLWSFPAGAYGNLFDGAPYNGWRSRITPVEAAVSMDIQNLIFIWEGQPSTQCVRGDKKEPCYPTKVDAIPDGQSALTQYLVPFRAPFIKKTAFSISAKHVDYPAKYTQAIYEMLPTLPGSAGVVFDGARACPGRARSAPGPWFQGALNPARA